VARVAATRATAAADADRVICIDVTRLRLFGFTIPAMQALLPALEETIR
jgi:hypothetical protein